MSILRPLHPTKSFQKLIWVYTEKLCLYTHKIVFLWVLAEDFFLYTQKLRKILLFKTFLGTNTDFFNIYPKVLSKFLHISLKHKYCAILGA